jgi:hypothetical protein
MEKFNLKVCAVPSQAAKTITSAEISAKTLCAKN